MFFVQARTPSISILALLVFVSACNRDPQARMQKYLHAGQHYLEQAQYSEAAIEFINAIQIDPNNAPAHYGLANTYLRSQKPQLAAQELARVTDLQADNYQARKDLANLLILGRDFTQAQDQVDLLLQKQPNDPVVHSLYSSLLAGRGDLHGAVREIQRAIELDPHWAFYLQLGMLQLRTNQADAAEVSFQKVISLNPGAVEARLVLGNFYQSRNRYDDAEQQFRNAIQLDHLNPNSWAALARLYVTEGKYPQAESLLQQAKLDFSGNSESYRMLADFYLATGHIGKAIAEYGALSNEHPHDLTVKKNYVQLLIQEHRLEDATKLNDEILQASPQDTQALVCRSQIQISTGNLKDATSTLQSLLKSDPSNADAHYVLGAALDAAGDSRAAENEWVEALRLRPDLVDAQRALAGSALRHGDTTRLTQYAGEIIRLQPNSPDGYALRALAKINQNQFTAAESDIHQALDLAPQSSMAYVQLGNLRLAQRKYAESGDAYQKALQLNPNSTDALRGVINSYVARKQIAQAVAVAKAQVEANPGNASFYDLLGTTLFLAAKDLQGAEDAFNKLLQLKPENPGGWMKLVQVQIAKGNLDQAATTCRVAINRQPKVPALYVVLGEIYQEKEHWTEAKEAFEQAHRLQPDDPIASRALASVLLQSGGSLSQALELAQSAQQNQPNSPVAADTLGWVYFHQGEYSTALNIFQQALKLQKARNLPDSADLHYHLGLAYQKTEHPALARQHLERALKIDPNYSEAGEINKQLSSLRS